MSSILGLFAGCQPTSVPESQGDGGTTAMDEDTPTPDDTTTEPGTSSSGTTGDTDGDDSGGWRVCEPPEQAEVCVTTAPWHLGQAAIVPELGTTIDMTADCWVYTVASYNDGTEMLHDTGLWCDIDDWAADRVIYTRVGAPLGTGHPLRPGDRVRAYVEAETWWRPASFVFRDLDTNAIVFGASAGEKPDPALLEPLEVELRRGLCSFEPIDDLCISGVAPAAVDLTLGQRTVTIFDGESATVGGVECFVRAAEYSLCRTCPDVPHSSVDLVYGTGLLGSPYEGCSLLMDDCDSGERCVAISTEARVWNATACVPNGPQSIGQPCTVAAPGDGIDDCGNRLVCVPDDDSATGGVCRGQCGGFAYEPTCSASDTCQLRTDLETPPGTCVPRCHPLTNLCPESDEVCVYLAESGFECVEFVGEAGANEGCDALNDCLEGLACLQPESVPDCIDPGWGCCTPYCSLSEPTCSPKLECAPFFDEPAPGFEDLGVCVLP